MNPFKLKFGIIGTNFITDKVIEGAHFDSRFELVAVYSRTQERADIFAQKHSIPHTFTSLEAMASSPLIDAVYIASPNAFHAPQSILFMNHGKHVLCEKPLASNAKEVRKMLEAAKANKVVLMEAMKPTLTPNFLAIRNNIKELGTIRRYFSCYCQYSSRYDSLKAGEVLNAFKPELSNGAVADIGIYTIYPMVVLFGRPKKVLATGLKLSTGVDGQGGINFEYEGMNATVMYSKIADSTLPTEIQGEEGTITADRINIIKNVELKYRNGNSKNISAPDAIHEYYYEVAEFISLVEQGKTESEINSHEHSLITIEIIDEIRKQLDVVYPADE
ncbi:Gfo/Idh/MocA family protein [Bacteroides sp. 519]|uniref:Gfo/Idh/MocA family protein n=1 Tax=Bacteroides sp. 519 TaxID=2302937 RepID=UPI0013D23D48|nr:Gfo/Idh/MocA family oxidoreductase [Bacteroides sp. 519]NDV58456.1 gfo/Idh/MocA family oxidoreductase [Bacteroides sp. 519]